MYHQRDTELLFPARVIPSLRDLQDIGWRELVASLCDQDEASLDGLGFSLTMVRLAGCLTCHAGAHRARLGCTTCAQQTIRRYKGTSTDLLCEYSQARADVEEYMQENDTLDSCHEA